MLEKKKDAINNFKDTWNHDILLYVEYFQLYDRDRNYLPWLFGGDLHVGKVLSLALGVKGVFVTVVDFSDEKGKEVASLIEKQNAKFHSKLEFPTAMFVRCDVANSSKFYH